MFQSILGLRYLFMESQVVFHAFFMQMKASITVKHGQRILYKSFNSKKRLA